MHPVCHVDSTPAKAQFKFFSKDNVQGRLDEHKYS